MTGPLFLAALAATAVTLTGILPGTANAEIPPVGQISRTSPAGNYLAAKVAGQARDMEAAAAYYQGALRADPRNAELIERTFLVVLASGDIEAAMPLAERVVSIEKDHRIARLALAIRAIKRNHFITARTNLSHSVRGPIADLTAALIGAWTLAGSKDFNGAIQSIDRLQGPDWYVAFKDLHAGMILDYAGRRADAGKRLERAYGHDKNALRTVDAYARWAARSGDTKKAIEIYDEFSKVLPDHPLVMAGVEEVKSSKSPAPLARTVQAGAAEVLFGLGTALGRQGGEDLGLVYLQLAQYLEPEHPLVLLSLGDLYESLKKSDLAIEAYARVPESSPLRRNSEIQRALNLDALERTDEARKLLDDLIAKDPKDLEAVTALGNILRARKDYDDAGRMYGRAIELVGTPTRQHWTLLYFRGICLERTKRWAEAEKDFEKALELFPDQPQVLNYLGYSWVDQGINLDRGLEHIRKAVELRPNDGYIVDSLGWAYYRLGRYDDAVKELERAIELRPEDPVINDHLGDAYWKVGRELEARFQWQHARDLKPEPDDLVKIEAKLKEGLPPDPAPAKAGAVKSPGDGG